jgi:hypothetical protein
MLHNDDLQPVLDAMEAYRQVKEGFVSSDGKDVSS